MGHWHPEIQVRWTRAAHFAVAALVAAGGLVAFPAETRAIFHFSDYTYGSSACSSYKDPVNFYYSGTGVGELSNALWYVQYGLHLTGTAPASNQWVNWYTGGHWACSQQNYNRKNNSYHTRLKGTLSDATYGPMTAGPIHQDAFVIWPLCGDVASTFNGARDWAYTTYRGAGYGLGFVSHWAGNTARMTQCDGRVVASDGWAYRAYP